MSSLAIRIDSFNRIIGKSVSVGILLMTIITFLVVILRYGFDAGWIALQESVLYLHAMVFMLGAAYTLREDGHVRVDVFYRGFSKRTQAMVNLGGIVFLLLPLIIFIWIASWDYVVVSWQLMESSKEAGGLPLVFLLKSLIPAFCFTMALQGLSDALRYWHVLQQHRKEVSK